MKIDKQELKKKIDQVKGVIPSKTVNEALKGVLYKDGYLIASDQNITVKAKLEGVEGAMEPFLIPSKSFDLINNYPAGEIEILTEKDGISLKSGRIKNKIRTLPAENFQFDRMSITNGSEAKMPATRLKDAISHVIYAVASEPVSNRLMTGMSMVCAGGKLVLVGLDGYRMALDMMPYDGDFSLIVPKTALDKLLKIDISGDVAISFDKLGALFRAEGYEIYTRLIDGQFFNYQRMLEKGDICVRVNRRNLIDATNRARLCAMEMEKTPTIMEIGNEGIRVIYKGSGADYSEEVSAESNGELRIAFQPKYVLDALQTFEQDVISMYFTSGTTPCIISDDETDMLAFVLPVNTGGK